MDERLRNEIKRVVRREMRTSRDFTWLSNKVWERVHERLSPTTLKRFFGYLDEGVSPSQFILDVLSRFIGYNGYNSFLDGEAPCEVQSLVVVSDKLTDKDLERGDCVRLSWPPDRCCVVMCLGEGHFVVSMAENTKLKVGDTFDCHLFIMNEPLFIDNLVHDGGKPVCYVAGKKDGITFEKL